MGVGVRTYLSNTSEGQKARAETAIALRRGYWMHNQEGVTLGQRYQSDLIMDRAADDLEPEIQIQKYEPTTWPGMRVPHVWLKDGKTSTVDVLSATSYNLVDFSEAGETAETFKAAADEIGLPLKLVRLPNEDRTRAIWQRDAVCVRPDGFSCWRGTGPVSLEQATRILRKVAGR